MIQKFQEYLNSRLLLLRLEISERISKTLAAFFKRMVLLMLFVLFLVFASIALALHLGEIMESMVNGFLVVSGGYFLLFILIWIIANPVLEKPIMNHIIRILFEKKHEEENTGQQS